MTFKILANVPVSKMSGISVLPFGHWEWERQSQDSAPTLKRSNWLFKKHHARG